MAHTRKKFQLHFTKIIKKMASDSPLWNEVYNIFPDILNKIESKTPESAHRISLPLNTDQSCWVNEMFLVIQGEVEDDHQPPAAGEVAYKPMLTIADLKTFKTTVIPNTRLSDFLSKSFLWKNYILQFVKSEFGNVMKVSKIVTNATGDISLVNDDVPKTFVVENHLPFQFELCSDSVICWNRTHIVFIDLKKLDSYWGISPIPSESRSSGIGEFIQSSDARSYTNVLSGAKLLKPTLGVKTLLYEILTLRQTEHLRKTERRLLAVNVDAFSSPPRISSLKWDALAKGVTVAQGIGWDLSSVVADYSVFNSGHVDQFAFLGPSNTLGIKLEGQDLKIHTVELDKFKGGKNTVHFGNVIIIQNENGNIICLNLSAEIVWALDAVKLRLLRLLPSIMIGKKLVLLHGKVNHVTVFVKAETGEVVSRVRDLHNPGNNRVGRVYWLGYRQLNVLKDCLNLYEYR